MKDDYKESSIDGALDLAVSVLAKAMDLTSAQPEKFEVAVMHKDAQGNVVQRLVDGAELDAVLARSKAFQKDEKK